MTFSVTDYIRFNKKKISRKLYVKRRSATDGSYESNWVQIDDWNGMNRVIDWGFAHTAIDENPGVVASFESSGLTLIVSNNDGLFNIETYPESIWHPETSYLNRRYTKVRIDTGYIKEDGEIAGELNSFEGIIDNVILSETGIATIECISYQSIFTKYPISDLSLTGSGTASSVLIAILNQTKITDFMPYIIPSLGYDYTINDASALDGTYWDVIQEIVFNSNSTITFSGSEFKIVPRVAGSVVWNFKGAGSDEVADIYQVNEYDDEGIGRIRVYWQESGGSTSAISTDSTLLLKYLSEPEIVDMSNVASGSKQAVLDALLAKWENNIPWIQFDCAYLLNQIDLLDKITIEIRGRLSPGLSEGGIRWGGGAEWGDGSIWGKELGGIIISSAVEWMVTAITRDFQTGKMSIRAEKVV